MQKVQIIVFLGFSVEDNSGCASNEISFPESPPASKSNSSIFLTAKRRFLDSMSPVKLTLILKPLLKVELLGKCFFELKIIFYPSFLNYVTLKLQSSNLIQVTVLYSKYFLGVTVTFI